MNLNGNYIDLIIIIVIAFFVFEGMRHGFWVILADFFAFLLSLLFSLKYYLFVANWLKHTFFLNYALGKALGFLVTAVVAEAILGFFFGYLLRLLPDKYRKKRIERFLAIFPALGEALVIVSFILVLIIGLPVKPSLKTDISQAKLGGLIIQKTQGIEVKLSDIFGGVVEDTLTYLIIKPESKERVSLTVDFNALSVDEKAESAMFELINEERKKEGIEELTWEEPLVFVAREHARDMWERKYFGHYSPEGKDVADRLGKAGIFYFVTGENLALAPTVSTAFVGLLNSEGHKRNILDANFQKVGIGVIDNKIYGKMFVQIFLK